MKGEVQLESSIAQKPTDSDPLLENQSDSSHGGTSDEIRDDEDAEAGSIPCCRICLESDAEPGQFHRYFRRWMFIFFLNSCSVKQFRCWRNSVEF